MLVLFLSIQDIPYLFFLNQLDPQVFASWIRIRGSTDPDPKGKISTKNARKKTPNPKLNYRTIREISRFLNAFLSFA